MNANLEALSATHGPEQARRIMDEVRDLGGYGSIPHEYVGGLDVQSVLDPSNTVINDKSKDRIAELLGIDRKEADRRVESGEVSSTDSLKDSTPKLPRANVK